jgi:hypothetical protein
MYGRMGKVRPLQKYSPACDVGSAFEIKQPLINIFFLVHGREIYVMAINGDR